MSALIINGSPNIASLDSAIEANLCDGIFTMDVTPSIWIGSGASNVLGASFKVTNPLGVIIKNYPTSGYDIYPPMTEDVQVNVPTQASNFQYGSYTFEVSLTDEDGTIYVLVKTVKICAPNPKNKTVNYGSLSATLDGNCVTGRVAVIADTPPTYNGFVSDSQVNDFVLKYPTVSEIVPIETTQNNFSVQLFEGEYQFSGTICAHYSYGDNVTANVNYKVKRFKTIRCLLDKACVAARLAELQYELTVADCTDAEKIATQSTIINALLLITVIDSLAVSGQDPSDFIEQLQKILNCECTCNCADGTPIIPLNPTGDFVVEGCNVTSETVGLTTTYTIENYVYLVDYNANGGALTVTAPVLNSCTKTQTINFNIAVVYEQIKAQIDDATEYDFWASRVNNTLDNVDFECLDIEQEQWDASTLAQRIQEIITRLCAGVSCDAVISANATEVLANDVTISWTNDSNVFEVAVYMDNLLVGTVLSPTESLTIVDAADGDLHAYRLISKCSNGASGNSLVGSFTYFGCPTIAAPTVSSNDVTEDCPFDLTSLVASLPSPIIAEWHDEYNTNDSSLVADPTQATDGVYYVYGLDAGTGCYSAIATRVVLSCIGSTSCSAPQNMLVEAITGGFRVRFQTAAYPPPANSYTVKRRLKSDPDISGSYTTIGSPTYNAGAARWEILDAAGANNTLYTYRAISNCASTAPYVDYDFANLVCPSVTLTPGDTTMGYSFTNSGGGIDKYEVKIYDSTGVTLIHTDTVVPAFSTPITGTFIYLDGGTSYKVMVKVFIGTYFKDCGFTSAATTSGDASIAMTSDVEVACARTMEFTITGDPSELIFYDLEYNHDVDGDNGTYSVTLDGAGEAVLNYVLGTPHYNVATGNERVTVTIINSTNVNNSITEAFSWSGCAV